MPKQLILKSKSVTCYFCKGINHWVSNYLLKDSYDVIYDGLVLIKYMTTRCPFSSIDQNRHANIITTDVSGRIGIKHVIVHMVHSKVNVSSLQNRPQEDDLAATVTYLDLYGKPMSGYNRCLLNLRVLIEYIYKHQRKSGWYIFSTLDREFIGQNFVNLVESRNLSQSDNTAYQINHDVKIPYRHINHHQTINDHLSRS